MPETQIYNLSLFDRRKEELRHFLVDFAENPVIILYRKSPSERGYLQLRLSGFPTSGRRTFFR